MQLKGRVQEMPRSIQKCITIGVSCTRPFNCSPEIATFILKQWSVLFSVRLLTMPSRLLATRQRRKAMTSGLLRIVGESTGAIKFIFTCGEMWMRSTLPTTAITQVKREFDHWKYRIKSHINKYRNEQKVYAVHLNNSATEEILFASSYWLWLSTGVRTFSCQ